MYVFVENKNITENRNGLSGVVFYLLFIYILCSGFKLAKYEIDSCYADKMDDSITTISIYLSHEISNLWQRERILNKLCIYISTLFETTKHKSLNTS